MLLIHPTSSERPLGPQRTDFAEAHSARESCLRVLILVDCYYPSSKSSAKLVHDLAVEICRRGDQAIVLTPSDTIANKFEARIEGAVTVARVKMGPIKGVPRVIRAVNEARLSARMWRRAESFLRQNPCDLILFYSPTIFFGELVRKLKRLWSCPAYLILRDIFPDWAVDAGVLKKGPIYHFFRRVATEQYRIADVIAVQSPANLRFFATTFPREKFQLKVLFNWTALDELALPRTDYRARLGLQDRTVFLYGGNLGVAQDMDNILRLAARLASRPDIYFLLVGDGSEMRRLSKSVELNRMRNVKILPGVAQGEYLAMVSEFDVGLISLDARLTSHNIPGKLLGYLYWGMPVLASVNAGNDLFELLHEGGAGCCLVNGDDEKLAQAALQFADDANLRTAMGRNARQVLEQTFSVQQAVDRIFVHLHETGLISTRRSGSTALIDAPAHPHELAEQI
jgi:O26-antigen biosynthesis N-acetyl-L-fucosamine transferase